MGATAWQKKTARVLSAVLCVQHVYSNSCRLSASAIVRNSIELHSSSNDCDVHAA